MELSDPCLAWEGELHDTSTQEAAANHELTRS